MTPSATAGNVDVSARACAGGIWRTTDARCLRSALPFMVEGRSGGRMGRGETEIEGDARDGETDGERER